MHPKLRVLVCLLFGFDATAKFICIGDARNLSAPDPSLRSEIRGRLH